ALNVVLMPESLTENPKSQIPSSKSQSVSTLRFALGLGFGAWDLGFGIYTGCPRITRMSRNTIATTRRMCSHPPSVVDVIIPRNHSTISRMTRNIMIGSLQADLKVRLYDRPPGGPKGPPLQPFRLYDRRGRPSGRPSRTYAATMRLRRMPIPSTS